MTKLWVDDRRHPPDDSWIRARGFIDAAAAVVNHGEPFQVISMDHDLGEHEPTGYDFVRWMIFHQVEKLPEVWRLHTDNPVGRDNMVGILESSKLYPYREKFGIGYVHKGVYDDT